MFRVEVVPEPNQMTTAARPTFDPARGGRGKGEGDLSALSKQYSSRDLPSHTKLKYRCVYSNCSPLVRYHCYCKSIATYTHSWMIFVIKLDLVGIDCADPYEL